MLAAAPTAPAEPEVPAPAADQEQPVTELADEQMLEQLLGRQQAEHPDAVQSVPASAVDDDTLRQVEVDTLLLKKSRDLPSEEPAPGPAVAAQVEQRPA